MPFAGQALHPFPPDQGHAGYRVPVHLICRCASSAQLSSGLAHPLKITPKIDAADSEAALDKTASTTGEASEEERQEV